MKMNFKQWVIDLFKDERGSTSVKPVIALLGALFLSVTMTINSFSHSDFAPAAMGTMSAAIAVAAKSK